MGSDERPRVLQVYNISTAAANDLIKQLFQHFGRIEDFQVYPVLVTEKTTQKVAYIRFEKEKSVLVAQHLTNTVFFDRAIVCVPTVTNSIPDEETALLNSAALGKRVLPSHVTNKVEENEHGQKMLYTIDPTLTNLGLLPYPPLGAELDSEIVEQTRRTIYVGNLKKDVNPEDVVKFFNTIGEVMYVKMANVNEHHSCAYAYVEFTNQTSVPQALQNDGVEFQGQPVRIQHSRVAIVKPQHKTDDQALEEIEEAIRRRDRGEVSPRRGRSRSPSPRRRTRTPSPRRSRYRSRSPKRSRGRDRDRDSKRRDDRRDRDRKEVSRSTTEKGDSKSRHAKKEKERRRSRSRSPDRRKRREENESRSSSKRRSRDKELEDIKDRSEKSKDHKKDKERRRSRSPSSERKKKREEKESSSNSKRRESRDEKVDDKDKDRSSKSNDYKKDKERHRSRSRSPERKKRREEKESSSSKHRSESRDDKDHSSKSRKDKDIDRKSNDKVTSIDEPMPLADEEMSLRERLLAKQKSKRRDSEEMDISD